MLAGNLSSRNRGKNKLQVVLCSCSSLPRPLLPRPPLPPPPPPRLSQASQPVKLTLAFMACNHGIPHCSVGGCACFGVPV